MREPAWYLQEVDENEFGDWGLGQGIKDLGSQVSGLGSRVSGVGCRVSGVECWVVVLGAGHRPSGSQFSG
jgi:hypothetical protein